MQIAGVGTWRSNVRGQSIDALREEISGENETRTAPDCGGHDGAGWGRVIRGRRWPYRR